ncbi:MAG: C45 family autoproteolytic acyltransferase/hydrolase [Crocinitomicaceae bacterium]|nr:C45 family autoproteolytic acyltransferase/hydrolase [Crocinitomicaceae bacterium]
MVKKIALFLAKAILGIFELFVGFLIVMILYIILVSDITPPEVTEIDIGERVQVSENHFTLGNNWLKKNDHGIWEMYIEGGPYERGLIYGELAKELIQKQEEIFVGQIDNFVPSDTWQQFLRLMLGFFNKDLPDNIALENQQEIYGVSQAFSDEYDYIAPKYDRILNYHAAHDIGHALNDYSMVGCTSFALKDSMTKDGALLVGRNFDFYVGDDFAEEKIVLFVKPDEGIPFVSYSWAGFTGVASGLNNEGLSVTINASKSDLPTSSKTPISLLAREILQYASTLEEAIAIAKKRETFVSETLLVSSKKDGKAVLIEKSPTKTGVFYQETSSLVCANHYQSDTFINDPINKQNILESDSKFRYNRVSELLSLGDSLSPYDAVTILRDQLGENGDTLGMGNPRAINQLIAHHSVVIQPESFLFYISTNDYQLGEYLGYDLKQVFSTGMVERIGIIPEDPFINSHSYRSFLDYRTTKATISAYLTFGKELDLTDNQIAQFIASNSELYITYEMLGRYYLEKKNPSEARKYFEIALTKNVASEAIREEFEGLIKECK